MTTEPRASAPSATLLANVRYVHGRDTCDEAGRPLSTYLCDYHQGYEDGLEKAGGLDTEWHAFSFDCEREADKLEQFADSLRQRAVYARQRAEEMSLDA